MRHVASSVEVAAPAAAVWPLLAEFRNWPKWGSTVRAVRVDGGAAAVAPGVTGRVQTVLRFWLPFRITTVEPGRSWHWRVAGVAATGHLVEALEPGRCRVALTVAWPLAPYVVALRLALRNVRRLAER